MHILLPSSFVTNSFPISLSLSLSLSLAVSFLTLPLWHSLEFVSGLYHLIPARSCDLRGRELLETPQGAWELFTATLI